MSVNALTTLFEEIAQAIKDKTGDTATMKPAEFPEKITGIQTGGGANVKCAFGTFTGTGSMLTVEHNLGVIPDVLFAYKKTKTASTTLLAIDSAFGVSSALATALNLPWVQFSTQSKKSGNYYEMGPMDCTVTAGGIDGTSTYGPGLFSNANQTSFKIGLSLSINQSECESGVEYKWLAIGGLVEH